MNFASDRLPKLLCFLFGLLLLTGCGEPAEKVEEKKPQSIIGQKTDEIGEFKGDAKEADLQVKQGSNPIAAAGGAYGFAVGQTSKLQIQHAVQLFQAEHGRFPKDHAEFMERIVKANSIKLPVLPGKRRYQYDVENHELKVVEAE